MWFPCWNGCDPQEVKCGDPYDVCVPADPEPCIATCLCPSDGEISLVFLTKDGICSRFFSVCHGKDMINRSPLGDNPLL